MRLSLPFKDAQQCFEDILANIARVERFTEGLTEETFSKDEEKIYAVQYALVAISEAAHRMKDQAETLCPGPDWRNIRGLGNWLRHGYDQIDTHVIWLVVVNDLPALKAVVTGALQSRHEPPPQE